MPTSDTRMALPVFAKPLSDARARGLTLKNGAVTVRLYSGPRPVSGYGVVVPDSQQPAALEWGWCRNLDVLIYHERDDGAPVMEAVTAIEAARPRRLLVVEFGSEKIVSIVDPAESPRAAA